VILGWSGLTSFCAGRFSKPRCLPRPAQNAGPNLLIGKAVARRQDWCPSGRRQILKICPRSSVVVVAPAAPAFGQVRKAGGTAPTAQIGPKPFIQGEKAAMGPNGPAVGRLGGNPPWDLPAGKPKLFCFLRIVALGGGPRHVAGEVPTLQV